MFVCVCVCVQVCVRACVCVCLMYTCTYQYAHCSAKNPITITRNKTDTKRSSGRFERHYCRYPYLFLAHIRNINRCMYITNVRGLVHAE